jgi:hypothetical protein
MKFSAVGAHVGCTTKAARPRTFSSISTCTSPSENRPTSALPGRMPSSRQTELANARLALPENTTTLSVFTAATLTTRRRIVSEVSARLCHCTATDPSA